MNEFSSLLKRTFEGLGYCCGDYEDAANAGLWLEKCGLRGLNAVHQTIERQPSLKPPLVSVLKTDSDTVFAGNKQSVIVCGSKIVELGVCRAFDTEKCSIEVRDCYERRAICAAFAKSSQIVAMLAYWHRDDKTNIAVSRPGALFPTLHQFDIANADSASASTLYLDFSRDTDLIDALVQQITAGQTKLRDLAPHRTMIDAVANATEHGLSVDRDGWNKLQVVANAILVKSTEQSRLGAGE